MNTPDVFDPLAQSNEGETNQVALSQHSAGQLDTDHIQTQYSSLSSEAAQESGERERIFGESINNASSDGEDEEPVSWEREVDQEGASHRRRSLPVKGWSDLATELVSIESEEERERMLNDLAELADAIWKIVEAKHENGGRAPRGSNKTVAEQFGLTIDAVDRLVKRMTAHEQARKHGMNVGSRLDAVRKGIPGRQKGKRDMTNEIKQAIIDRWRVGNAKSLNHTGAADPIVVHLHRKMVYKWVRSRYPDANISRTTVWRIIDDFEEQEVAKSKWSRGNVKEVIDNILTVDIDYIGANYYWVLDIRPLPIRSRYKNMLCTTGLLQIIDAFSAFRLASQILPRKDIDEDGNVFGVDFTCKHVRMLLALAILTYKIRPRVIYVDNGTQFGPALEKFLDLLTPIGEPPTEIIHTEPGEPRGRGVIERALALIDAFIQYKPGVFPEGDYRKTIKLPKGFRYYDFDFLVKEFQTYEPIWNDRKRDGKLSPREVYEQGPNYGYAPPSEFQLGLFAGSLQKVDKRGGRSISREGVRIKNTMYVPANDSPVIGEQLASAANAKEERECITIKIGELQFLYVKLDGTNWTPFIKKSERRISAHMQKKYRDDIKAHLAHDQQAAEERLQLAMLNDLGQELIIDPYNEEWIWHDPPQTPTKDNKRKTRTTDQPEAPSENGTGSHAQETPPVQIKKATPTQGDNATDATEKGAMSAGSETSLQQKNSDVLLPAGSTGFLSRRRRRLEGGCEENAI